MRRAALPGRVGVMTTVFPAPSRALWIGLCLLALAALALVGAPLARATVTSTRIEEPASPFFSIFD
jgi:hypothetical protein